MANNEVTPRWCRWLVRGFLALYAVALALFLIGTFGWFGSPSGPLAAVFLVPLGIPWVFVLESLSMSEGVRFWLALSAPLLNLALLAGLCRLLRR